MIAFVVYYIIPAVLALVFVIAVISAVVGFRRYKKSPYFRLRQQAARQGWRSVAMALVALAGMVGAVFARQVIEPPAPQVGPTPTLPLLEGAVTPVLPSPTPVQGQPPTITPTDAAPALPTPTMTAVITTLESSVTPPAQASMSIAAISSDISQDLQPVGVSEDFPVGTTRIYYWLEYENMADGMSWSQVLYRDGQLIRSESGVWGEGEEGLFYFFFGAQGGWPAGIYEIQFFIGEELVASQTYEVVN
jgi:hypothetical protein